ncbi:MAG: HRDC domain-containing protein [Bryobacterales bacterium]|nr:HRDC domain-containing protein [Bryobacterales bacterium]
MRTDRTTAIEAALKAWRLAEAKKKGVPAFRVMTDKVLRTIAETEPATTRELLAVPGIGLNTVEKFGAIIFRILQKAG